MTKFSVLISFLFIGQLFTQPAFQAPLVKVSDFSLSGDGDLRPMATFNLQISVQNTGQGVAKDISTGLKLPEYVILLGGEEMQRISQLMPGETRNLTYEVIINSKYSLSTVPISMSIRESYGKYAESWNQSFAMNQKMDAPRKLGVAAQAQEKVNNEVATSNTNSQMIKLGNYELEFSKEKKSWSEVKEYCSTKGNGWFIPNPEQMQIIVSRFKIPQTMVLWTSKSAWSGSGTISAGKQWTDSDMDVAEVFDMSSRTIESKYKTDRYDFVIARSLGTGLEKVKSSLSEAYVIGDLTVSKYELRDLNFATAQSMCNSLGDGWRLPTVKELEQIFAAGRTSESDLTLSYYYSSERTCPNCYDSYWAFSKLHSKKTMFDKSSKLRVIPVKSNTAGQSNSLTTLNFGEYVVTKNFFGPMTFAEAENFCASQSAGPYNRWTITTMSQLSSLKVYKSEIPGMIGKQFMSYEYKTQHFERNDMSTVKIEPQGFSETWMGGSETSKFYFFMAKRNVSLR